MHFVVVEDILEFRSTCVMPKVSLKVSGHVDKFTDVIVKDEKTRTYHHADHLLKNFCKDKLEKDLSIFVEMAAKLEIESTCDLGWFLTLKSWVPRSRSML
ncbi:hypothetical protein Dsin_022573 [Dipteronia sinensis]|uniref:Uncharacterized protein n=1 Tax=Dipteronia sinensis TaxID=43782 RepID=A0AAE0A222_9ROSI|nr:hypothetical protein Dsin_022573 [Dipteronia sinensis]